jgi:hypothetical protein
VRGSDEIAERRDDERDEQGDKGQKRVIGDGDAALIGQHGDEMRGPDRAAHAHAGDRQPAFSEIAPVLADLPVNIKGDEALDNAHEDREQQQAIIVLGCKAAQDAIHQFPQSMGER